MRNCFADGGIMPPQSVPAALPAFSAAASPPQSRAFYVVHFPQSIGRVTAPPEGESCDVAPAAQSDCVAFEPPLPLWSVLLLRKDRHRRPAFQLLNPRSSLYPFSPFHAALFPSAAPFSFFNVHFSVFNSNSKLHTKKSRRQPGRLPTRFDSDVGYAGFLPMLFSTTLRTTATRSAVSLLDLLNAATSWASTLSLKKSTLSRISFRMSPRRM